MDDCYRNLSRIPVSNIAASLNLTDVEALLDSAKVMSEPIGHKERLFIGSLDDVFQSVQLPIVKLNDLPGVGINGTVCKLCELACKRCGICCGHFTVGEL